MTMTLRTVHCDDCTVLSANCRVAAHCTLRTHNTHSCTLPAYLILMQRGSTGKSYCTMNDYIFSSQRRAAKKAKEDKKFQRETLKLHKRNVSLIIMAGMRLPLEVKILIIQLYYTVGS